MQATTPQGVVAWLFPGKHVQALSGLEEVSYDF